jgi:hypothetical protein
VQGYRWNRKVRNYDGTVEDFVILVRRHEGIQGSMSVPPFLLAVYVNIGVVVPREEMNNGIGNPSQTHKNFQVF